jgi:hypothetical protein
MADKSPYIDKRLDFFKNYFDSGLPYDDYVSSGSDIEIEKWRGIQTRVNLSDAQKTRLGSFTRRMNILVMSGIWCGDCVRQGPMLNAISSGSQLVEARFVESRQKPELQEELRINGAHKVPVVVVLSEDFYELSRFGDRHLGVYRRKAASELGPACDAGLIGPSDEELTSELDEWLDYLERLQLMLRLAPLLRKRYGD